MLNQPNADPHLPEVQVVCGELGSLRSRIAVFHARRPREEPGGPKGAIFEVIERDLKEMLVDIEEIRSDLNRQDP